MRTRWTDELLKEEALKYNAKNEFLKGNVNAYMYSSRKGILDEICSHMSGNIKWTNELLKEEALKYNTKNDFNEGNVNAYSIAYRRGILDEICSHMNSNIKWTYDMLKEEALKYNSRSSFRKENYPAYSSSQRKGILDEICSHMKRLGNIYNRFVYTIEFENGSVYVGLTCDLERRKLQHIKNSSNKYVSELIYTNIKYKFNTDNILYDVNEAIKIECLLIEKYRNKGYKVLNISKGGGLGGNVIKWTDENIKEEALKYNNRSSFKRSSLLYSTACKRGILDEICKHMKKVQ
jgi:predicted GIY-YIG superfamily endonuclease